MAKMIKPSAAQVRERLRHAAADSGMTMEEIGVRMGFSKSGARQAVSRLLSQEDYDPRLSTLVAFASAIGRTLPDLISEKKAEKSK